jgi:hypothetical protein
VAADISAKIVIHDPRSEVRKLSCLANGRPLTSSTWFA